MLRVNGDYLGCVVGPGKQNVLLEFRPDSLRRGLLASLAGLGLTAAALVYGMAPFRRPPRPEECRCELPSLSETAARRRRRC